MPYKQAYLAQMAAAGQPINPRPLQDLLQHSARNVQVAPPPSPGLQSFAAQQDAFTLQPPPPPRRRRGADYDLYAPNTTNNEADIDDFAEPTYQQHAFGTEMPFPSDDAVGPQDQYFGQMAFPQQMPDEAGPFVAGPDDFLSTFEQAAFANSPLQHEQDAFDSQADDSGFFDSSFSSDQSEPPAAGGYRHYIPEQYDHDLPGDVFAQHEHQLQADAFEQHERELPAAAFEQHEHELPANVFEQYQREYSANAFEQQDHQLPGDLFTQREHSLPAAAFEQQPPAQNDAFYHGVEVNATDVPNGYHSDSSHTLGRDTSSVYDHFSTPATSFNDDDDIALHFNNLADAMSYVNNPTKLTIKQDNWREMEANPRPYIVQIIKAFKTKGTNHPHGHDFDEAEQKRWQEFQQTHLDKVTTYSIKSNLSIELAAWSVFNAAIEAHKLGIKNFKQHEWRDSCLDRFNEVLQVITDLAIVRWDIIRLIRIDDLVRDPVAFTNRKMANFTGNTQKKKRDEDNAEKAKESGIEYNSVLGTKRKKLAEDAEKKRKREEEEEAHVVAPAPKKPRMATPVPKKPVLARKQPRPTTT